MEIICITSEYGLTRSNNTDEDVFRIFKVADNIKIIGQLARVGPRHCCYAQSVSWLDGVKGVLNQG